MKENQTAVNQNETPATDIFGRPISAAIEGATPKHARQRVRNLGMLARGESPSARQIAASHSDECKCGSCDETRMAAQMRALGFRA